MKAPCLQESDQEKTERLKCYFSLLSEKNEEIWVNSKGLSMLPLFYRGVKVRIDPDIEKYKVGSVVVFHRENKYIAHRIISHSPNHNFFATKGDTQFYFDEPVKKEELLGLVTNIKKGNKEFHVEINQEISRLSGGLGRQLYEKLDWLPDWLKFLYYFFFFIPGYLKLFLLKK